MTPREKLSVKYDELYKKADILFKTYKPCQFKDGSCRCNKYYNKKNGCCGWGDVCKFLGPEGCMVKSLGCKIFMCSDIRYGNKEFSEKLNKVRKDVEDVFNYSIECYETKEEYFKSQKEVHCV